MGWSEGRTDGCGEGCIIGCFDGCLNGCSVGSFEGCEEVVRRVDWRVLEWLMVVAREALMAEAMAASWAA